MRFLQIFQKVFQIFLEGVLQKIPNNFLHGFFKNLQRIKTFSLALAYEIPLKITQVIPIEIYSDSFFRIISLENSFSLFLARFSQNIPKLSETLPWISFANSTMISPEDSSPLFLQKFHNEFFFLEFCLKIYLKKSYLKVIQAFSLRRSITCEIIQVNPPGILSETT